MARTLEEVRESILDTGSRPEIPTTGRFLREVVDDSLAALDNQGLYLRGGTLVRIDDGQAFMMRKDALRGKLERVADYMKTITKGGAASLSPSRVPPGVAEDILSLPAKDLPFQHLVGIAHTPVLTKDGRLLTEPGYDAESGIFLRLRGLSQVNASLDVQEAFELLDDVLADFPYVNAAGKSYSMAMILQPLVRQVFEGPSPLYLLDAPLRGSGKTLLIDVCTSIITGQSAPVMALARDGDEVEKRITTMLLAGVSHILLDNVAELASNNLAAALTSETWRSRLLGKSELVEVSNHAVWMASGNNVNLSDEIARRTMPIRLDPGIERPEERTDFRHPRLKSYVRENRHTLLSAAVSIVRAWAENGMPRSTASIGSYEGWAGAMGGLLQTIGLDGFLEERDQLHEHSDHETSEWIAFVREWERAHGDRAVTAKDLLPILKRANLLFDLWGRTSQETATKNVGHALKRNRDRVYGALKISAAGKSLQTRNNAYRLVALEKGLAKKHKKHPKTPQEHRVHPQEIAHPGNDAPTGPTLLPRDDVRRPVDATPSQEIKSVSGVSGVSGVLNQSKVVETKPRGVVSLSDRAKELLTQGATLEPAVVLNTATQALKALGGKVPPTWFEMLETQPLVVYTAVQMIQADLRAGTLRSRADTYLAVVQTETGPPA